LVRSGLIAWLGELAAATERADDVEVTALALKILKDVSFRATAQEQEQILYPAGLNIVLLQNNTKVTHVLETATNVLWNWTSSGMALTMAADSRVWKFLEQTSEHVAAVVVQRHVASTVGTMVASCTTTKSSRVNIPSYEQQIQQQQSWLVPYLKRVLRDESDQDWRRRCVRTVKCLASTEWGVRMLGSDWGNVLVKVLQSTTDDVDTRCAVCHTMQSLLPVVTVQESNKADCYRLWTLLGPCLETALVQTVEQIDSPSKLVLAASQTLTHLLRHSPWRRGYSSFSRTFLERLLSVLQEQVNEPDYHATFAKLLLQLLDVDPSSEDDSSSSSATSRSSGRKNMSHWMASSRSVSEMLTIMLNTEGHPDLERSKQTAVDVLKILAQEDGSNNKKLLAANEHLLTALVNVCLVNGEGPLKAGAKELILQLVPEL
jgi:hypothetical protein